jgi:hypothetical protein
MPFDPPAASRRQLDGVSFAAAADFAPAAKSRFDAADAAPGNDDPSRCKALLKFPDRPGVPGPVFWSSKMAIDADGPAAGPGRLSGSQLDPGNGPDQDSTWLTFTDAHGDPVGRGLPSETVPYVVLPSLKPKSTQTFDPALAKGDVAVVIYKDKVAAAICGDLGPCDKIGEASIRVHEALQQPGCPDPCDRRDDSGYCRHARNSSVPEDVLFFVFPNSAFADGELTYANVNSKIAERAFALYNKFRGAS